MSTTCTCTKASRNGSVEFYRHALEALNASGVPFLMGGAYALEQYTGNARYTKDLDILVRRHDLESLLKVLAREGYRTELTFPHWLGKAYHGSNFIDVIFSAGNGTARIDDQWFEHAVPGAVLGVPVRLASPEDMIWSKAYVMERDRYDGADIAHLLRACGKTMNWQRLLDRFAQHWRVLFSHLILFGFIYPSERDVVPKWLLRELSTRLNRESATEPAEEPLCYGTLLSREQYLADVGRFGFRDARLAPVGTMTRDEIEHWTAAIGQDK